MFVEVEYEWTVTVQPSCLRSSLHLKEAVLSKLLKDFEGKKCTAQGYLVSLTSLEHIGEERIWERTGLLAFPVRFRCVVFTLVKGEYVLAIATKISNLHIVCACGPVDKLYIPEEHLRSYKYVNPASGKDGKGGTSEGAPISHWVQHDGQEIHPGDVLKVRVVGVKWEPGRLQFKAVGSLDTAYAGLDHRFPDTDAPHKGNNVPLNEDNPDAWGGPVDNDNGWGEAPMATDDDGTWAD